MALIYRSWRLAREDRVADDEADVALRSASAGATEDTTDAMTADTEFGTRASAAVSTARDLEEQDEQASSDAIEGRDS
jgi:hypothetical protein